MRSTTKEDVDREIGILLDGKDEMDELHCQPLEDIIKNHRLRTVAQKTVPMFGHFVMFGL